ncbi:MULTISPECIES: NAD(P)/FAD-dependent oxidoreductase [unclassified Cryobacterium]|uniref:NAD(P)/FAD-dependent oxidoreductase n=1 Tax=unclassified Cryobacterium TaxID=2649013 RepID=UPI002AB5B4F5|nr:MULTISPECIES: FAD-dependent oxidoreductase [unclassified Cryobacterium]MDY7541361.1 FAD-dependent oxidoreductase [Cryobacterium sp. 5B3]MEA9998161.1 FAD-dependent oxidoreductase [Cryobacterium sp. RTS3]MEB0265351.1 FAD-dependent oxidoreductase [Cryobacterium sp. 10I5]MEB0273340.1 FAD-dependent oxidoreductase [Cryobacterium sp. 5B3]
MKSATYVIVGAGLAGARAAEALRAEGFDGRVVLLGEEAEYPYIRPPLSKDFLAGTSARDSIDVHPTDWYAAQDIEVVRGRAVTALTLDARQLTFADGKTLRYDRLLLATGATARPFPGSGGDLAGVHLLRTVGDSARLKAALAPGGRRVVVIGAGWIGLEVAAAARGYGNDVTVLGQGAVPLQRAVGAEIGAVFAALHRANGVDLRMETGVSEILGTDGKVTGVRLHAEADGTPDGQAGEVVPADVVVVGIGATPNTRLALDAGLEVADGIVVDAAFRTNEPGVFAVGDVASVFHPVLGHHLRVEHWANAENAGRAAALSMLDRAVSYEEIPYFYTDQFDLGMEYSGYGDLAGNAELVFRGDRASREFIAFWVADGRVVAGMNVNVWEVNGSVQNLIRSRVRVDVSALRDESRSLDSLLGPAGAQTPGVGS